MKQCIKTVLAMHFSCIFPQVTAFLCTLKASCKHVQGFGAGWALIAKFKLEKEGRAQGSPATRSFLDLVQILQTAAKWS